MKKFIAAIPLLIALPAVAQSNVTIYGIIDNGVEYVSNVNAAGKSVVKMPANTSITSRLGFKGTEDLGGGMTANFVLENGFTPDTGGLAQGEAAFWPAVKRVVGDSLWLLHFGSPIHHVVLFHALGRRIGTQLVWVRCA